MISSNDILNTLKEKVSNTSVDTSSLKHDHPLRSQGVDSLDISILMFALEEEHSIKIPTGKIGDLLSLEDFKNYINKEKST